MYQFNVKKMFTTSHPVNQTLNRALWRSSRKGLFLNQSIIIIIVCAVQCHVGSEMCIAPTAVVAKWSQKDDWWCMRIMKNQQTNKCLLGLGASAMQTRKVNAKINFYRPREETLENERNFPLKNDAKPRIVSHLRHISRNMSFNFNSAKSCHSNVGISQSKNQHIKHQQQ